MSETPTCIEYSIEQCGECFRYPGLKPPMVGGCDLVGEVVEDRSGSLAPGDKVVFNGWGVGTDHYGGYAGMASLRHVCKRCLSLCKKIF